MAAKITSTSEQVDGAVKIIRNNGARSLSDARRIIDALISQEIVQWPTEPRIVSDWKEAAALPFGAVVRDAEGLVLTRNEYGWYQTADEISHPATLWTYPAEVLG